MKSKEETRMEELHDRYIRFDWAIKRLLRQKANFAVLEGFLTVFLGEKITISEILESEGNQLAENDKFNRVDIKALNSKGEIIIIEIQNTRELYYLERILYGVAKAITEHIYLGDSYYKVKKVYSISILYFDIGQGKDYLYHGQNNFIGVHTNDKLIISTKEKSAIIPLLPSEIFPEYILIRVNEFNKVAISPIEEWMRYLKDGIINPGTTTPGLNEAREKLKYYSMSPSERHAYDEHINAMMIQNDVLDTAKLEGLIEGREEGWQQGIEEGRREGRKEGRKEGIEEGIREGIKEGIKEGENKKNIEHAKKMESLGISHDVIKEITGLNIDEYRDNHIH